MVQLTMNIRCCNSSWAARFFSPFRYQNPHVYEVAPILGIDLLTKCDYGLFELSLVNCLQCSNASWATGLFFSWCQDPYTT